MTTNELPNKIKCPYCDEESDIEDVKLQREHLTKVHPKEYEKWMNANGFRRDETTGYWIDGWASEE